MYVLDEGSGFTPRMTKKGGVSKLPLATISHSLMYSSVIIQSGPGERWEGKGRCWACEVSEGLECFGRE